MSVGQTQGECGVSQENMTFLWRSLILEWPYDRPAGRLCLSKWPTTTCNHILISCKHVSQMDSHFHSNNLCPTSGFDLCPVLLLPILHAPLPTWFGMLSQNLSFCIWFMYLKRCVCVCVIVCVGMWKVLIIILINYSRVNINLAFGKVNDIGQHFVYHCCNNPGQGSFLAKTITYKCVKKVNNVITHRIYWICRIYRIYGLWLWLEVRPTRHKEGLILFEKPQTLLCKIYLIFSVE